MYLLGHTPFVITSLGFIAKTSLGLIVQML